MICSVWQVFQLGQCDRCGSRINRENEKNTGISYYDTRYFRYSYAFFYVKNYRYTNIIFHLQSCMIVTIVTQVRL